MALAKKHDRSVGALGARWGMQSESDSEEVESLDSRSEALRE